MNRFSSQPPEFYNPEQLERWLRANLRITLTHNFKDPEKLDEYVERTAREKALIQQFDLELRQLDRRILKPINKAYTKQSWEMFIDVLVRIHRERMDHYYRDRLFYIVRKLVFKDFMANHSEGSYR